MRILLVINSLVGGGAERVAVLLAEGFARCGHDVSLLTTRAANADQYQLSESVQRYQTEPPRRASCAISRNLSILRAIRRTADVSGAEVVISFMPMENIRSIIALWGSARHLVVTEHDDVDGLLVSKPALILKRLLYPAASQIVCVSAGVAQGISWLSPSRVKIIYNPVRLPESHARNGSLSPSRAEAIYHIVAMGRLEHQKGFDLLIEAFARIADANPQWQLTILGEGKMRGELERLVESKRLVGRVHLPGFEREPFSVFAAAQLFVLSSRWEPFGLALAEAMACGLPVISFDCPWGPAEIIDHDHDGVLVEAENVVHMARAMAELMHNPARRSLLGERAAQSVRRFDIERVIASWEQLFRSLLSQRPRIGLNNFRHVRPQCWYDKAAAAEVKSIRQRLLPWVRAYTMHRWLPFKYRLAEALVARERICCVDFECDFFGLRYRGQVCNEIDWNVFLFGAYAREELELFRAIAVQLGAHLRMPVVFCDVGANVGNHALFMARYCGSVHCFEPYPPVFTRLKEQVERNGIENICLHPVALGNAAGTLQFFEPPKDNLGMGSLHAAPDNSQGSVSVPVVRGDDYFASSGVQGCHLLKIDVEGFEVDVLRGLSETIKRERPVILMELSDATKEQLGSLSGLISLIYPDAEIRAVRKTRAHDYRLDPLDFARSSEILIVPRACWELLTL